MKDTIQLVGNNTYNELQDIFADKTELKNTEDYDFTQDKPVILSDGETMMYIPSGHNEDTEVPWVFMPELSFSNMLYKDTQKYRDDNCFFVIDTPTDILKYKGKYINVVGITEENMIADSLYERYFADLEGNIYKVLQGYKYKELIPQDSRFKQYPPLNDDLADNLIKNQISVIKCAEIITNEYVEFEEEKEVEFVAVKGKTIFQFNEYGDLIDALLFEQFKYPSKVYPEMFPSNIESTYGLAPTSYNAEPYLAEEKTTYNEFENIHFIEEYKDLNELEEETFKIKLPYIFAGDGILSAVLETDGVYFIDYSLFGINSEQDEIYSFSLDLSGNFDAEYEIIYRDMQKEGII